jgi:hypothetical protein
MKERIKKIGKTIIDLGLTMAALALLFFFLWLLSATAKASDYTFLDSTFRAMEKREYGGAVDFKNRVFNITQNVNLPRIGTDNKTKVFTIENLCVKGAGLIAASKDWNDEHNYQTNRTFNLRNINIYNADAGLTIQGSHRSYFENVCAWNCRKAGSFELCLEGYAVNLQEHQCRDTGFYIGWSRNLPGATWANSQSNNFRINGFRSYGVGNSIALLFESVSGCSVTNLTNEGAGCNIFLKVSAQGSTVMKDFYAAGFHIECENKRCVVLSECYGYSMFTFENIFAQVGNVFCEASGTGLVTIRNIFYQPYNAGWKKPCLMFSHQRPDDNTVWWVFDNCNTLSSARSYYNDIYWINDATHCKPRPFSTGQQTNNSGSNRLKEIPFVLN